METAEEYLIIGAVIAFALLLYFMMPAVFRFVSNNSRGSKGLLFLLAVSAMLDAVYSAFGYRGESLLYMTALIIFIALMVWLYFNYRSIDIYVSGRYGQAAAAAVFLVIILAVWLFGRLLL